jgi:aspartate-semialdehyde dehydrogenase
LERQLLQAGLTVFSNSPYGRFDEENPLVVTEVNGEYLAGRQLIKNPNCVTSGLALILAPQAPLFVISEAGRPRQARFSP